VDYLFEFGPVRAEGPLEAEHIRPIEHVLEVKFKPWEKRLLLRLSREYKGEMHAATRRDAPPPWEGAAAQWKAVQMHQMERNLDTFLK
jgi:hypothetical protein